MLDSSRGWALLEGLARSTGFADERVDAGAVKLVRDHVSRSAKIAESATLLGFLVPWLQRVARVRLSGGRTSLEWSDRLLVECVARLDVTAGLCLGVGLLGK